MKITQQAIKALTTKTKTRLAMELNCSVYTVAAWIKENRENGMLTTAKALQVIREETGLDDQQILEDEKESELIGGERI